MLLLELTDVEGQVTLRLEVVGYEFPSSENDDWCLVRARVRQGEERFAKTDPALEAPELLEIRDWFDRLGQGRDPKYANLTFTEPCLAFELLERRDAAVRISIHLGAELQPGFPLRQLGGLLDRWRIVFELPRDRLLAIAKNTEAALRRYPARS